MYKEKIIGFIKIFNILLIAGIGFILFLGSGYTLLALFESNVFRIMMFGYCIALIFGIFAYKKNYFLWLSLFGWIIFGLGFQADTKKAIEKNQQLCIELRAEPSCIEDECGFDCSNFHGAGFVTGGSVCENKDMSLCAIKRNNIKQIQEDTQDVLKVYSDIVDKIIASPSPANENFENQLVAIYNCLESKYGPGAKGELMAIQILKQKNLMSQQLNKYYLYLSRNGNSINTDKIVAGLPNGDKKFSCEYIGVK